MARHEYEVWYHQQEGTDDEAFSQAAGSRRIEAERLAREIAGRAGVHAVMVVRRSSWEVVYQLPTSVG